MAYNETLESSTDDDDYLSENAVKDEAGMVYQTLLKMGHVPDLLPVKTINETVSKLQTSKPELIFNLCEGFRGNSHHEMNLAALWELMDIPFTGNSPLTLGMAQNKALAKKLFDANGIATPAYEVYTGAPSKTSLKYPLIAKPAMEDASLGIRCNSLIKNYNGLKSSVEKLLKKYKQPVLVEEFIDGREFNVSIIGGKSPKALPVSEIDFSGLDRKSPRITSYEAKWLTEHPLYEKTPSVCPAKLDKKLKKQIEEVALSVYSVLMAEDYGRVDLRVSDKNGIFVLEYNPNPDISPDAGFVKSLKAAGISYEGFVDFLINENLKRK